jgi:RND superfamily putative drug exporter
MKKANASYDELTTALLKLNTGLQAIADNTNQSSQLFKGMTEIENGAKALSEGLNKGSAGQETVISNMKKIESGAEKIKMGQEKLYNGLSALGSGMGKLKDGISKSADGLGTISNGLDKANSFLNKLTDNTRTFYIPAEALNTKDINKMLDAYMSKDRKIAKLTVNLNYDPYSPEAVKLVSSIDNIVKSQLKGTVLYNAKYGVSGPTAITNDLSNIATGDIVFTRIIVLICIFILLIFVIRSFWIPVYIIGSLVIAYYTSMSITGLVTLKLFKGVGGLSWNVPFFAFVMIASLGVDYSIFLMTRFKEYKELSPNEAMVMAAKNVGGVVISAAIILSGTFATLYPSNLHVLMELAICVVIGLMMLSLMLLPVVIPSLIAVSQKIKNKNS